MCSTNVYPHTPAIALILALALVETALAEGKHISTLTHAVLSYLDPSPSEKSKDNRPTSTD